MGSNLPRLTRLKGYPENFYRRQASRVFRLRCDDLLVPREATRTTRSYESRCRCTRNESSIASDAARHVVIYGVLRVLFASTCPDKFASSHLFSPFSLPFACRFPVLSVARYFCETIVRVTSLLFPITRRRPVPTAIKTSLARPSGLW